MRKRQQVEGPGWTRCDSLTPPPLADHGHHIHDRTHAMSDRNGLILLTTRRLEHEQLGSVSKQDETAAR